MDPKQLFARYQELQRYVGWTEEDAGRVLSVAALLEPHFAPLIDDFYDEIERHPEARKVITGGAQQIARLKGTLRDWLHDLIHGPYDQDYVHRRWKVGYRHVEIGLSQVFTNVALSRLRRGVMLILEKAAKPSADLQSVRRSLNTLLDLDLAIIEEAYQAEYMQRLQRTERLAAIGQIAGGIAHELRNPLNVVKTSIYYIVNARKPDPAKTKDHLQRIERQVNLADGVITALSNFAKMPLPDFRSVAVDACLKEVLETTPTPAGVSVQVNCPAGLPPILVDVDQGRIVFSNLVRNAFDAMAGGSGGQLSLTARRVEDNIEIDVADTGSGIAPELLNRIMEPLYSTKARGLGLGLAIVRTILEKNRGSLRVVSELGKGTTFTVTLAAALG